MAAAPAHRMRLMLADDTGMNVGADFEYADDWASSVRGRLLVRDTLAKAAKRCYAALAVGWDPATAASMRYLYGHIGGPSQVTPLSFVLPLLREGRDGELPTIDPYDPIIIQTLGTVLGINDVDGLAVDDNGGPAVSPAAAPPVPGMQELMASVPADVVAEFGGLAGLQRTIDRLSRAAAEEDPTGADAE